jgi:DNA-binding NarL/FixJ family response regulator
VKRTSILLADDHTMVAAGLRRVLEPEYDVVGSVDNGLKLLQAAADLKPDLLIVDVGMPLLNGLDAARELRKAAPSIKIIFLTMNPDSDVANEAIRLGISGYLLKTCREDELLQAIRNALKGLSYISPSISQAIEENFIRDPRTLTRPKHLTTRQVQIMQMLSEGQTMKDIARILNISFRTVRFHKYQIMQELQIKSIAELVQYAIKYGIITPR